MSERTEQQSVLRVREALARLGALGEVRALDSSARTAAEAAAALDVEVGQIANSLIFMADGEPVLVMASGGGRVDTVQLAAILEVNDIEKATADQVREATGFAIGGVAPVGHPEPLRTIVDIALSRYDVIWAGGRTPALRVPNLVRRTAAYHCRRSRRNRRLTPGIDVVTRPFIREWALVGARTPNFTPTSAHSRSHAEGRVEADGEGPWRIFAAGKNPVDR